LKGSQQFSSTIKSDYARLKLVGVKYFIIQDFVSINIHTLIDYSAPSLCIDRINLLRIDTLHIDDVPIDAFHIDDVRTVMFHIDNGIVSRIDQRTLVSYRSGHTASYRSDPLVSHL
jgi:hypothetical protein